MTDLKPLTESEIRQGLEALPEWHFQDHAIVRTAKFPGFLRAIEFINAVAHLAERQDHHPDIDLRYREVTLRYWTHVAGGVTPLDFHGAKEAEALVAYYQKPPVSVAAQ